MTAPSETIIARDGKVFLQVAHVNGLVEEHEIYAKSGHTRYATLSPDCQLLYGDHQQALPEKFRTEVYRLADLDSLLASREALLFKRLKGVSTQDRQDADADL